MMLVLRAMSLVLLISGAAAQSVSVGNAVLNGGCPVGVQFDSSWSGTGYTEVRLTFSLVRNGQTLDTAPTEIRTMIPGSDTYSIQFSQSAQAGDEIHVHAEFIKVVNGQTSSNHQYDSTGVTAPPV